MEEGDTVVEGQPLLTIDTDQIAADGSDVNAALLDTLLAQKELLAKNIKAEEQRAGSERERLIVPRAEPRIGGRPTSVPAQASERAARGRGRASWRRPSSCARRAT